MESRGQAKQGMGKKAPHKRPARIELFLQLEKLNLLNDLNVMSVVSWIPIYFACKV